MGKKSLKIQMAGFLSGVIFLAMLLVSLVWGMFLKRDLEENEIARLKQVLGATSEIYRIGATRIDERLQSIAEKFLHSNGIECFALQVGEWQAVQRGDETCLPDEILEEVRVKTWKKQDTVIAYQGTTWAVFTFSHRQVVVGKPVQDDSGKILGTVVVGSSLEPVYAGIRAKSKVVLFYIVVNTIIFAGIGLLRMMHIIVKPLERFISLSKQYSPHDDLNFFMESGNNEFTSLSRSLNNLFSRIRADNEKLRITVELLESANMELERNKKEMVRTEKLAAIGRLSAGLAHEIGNPLGIVQGYIDLLGRNDLSIDERAEFSGNSQLELDRIKTLIRQLLDFARPAMVPEQPISVNQLIDDMLHFVGMEKNFAHCTIIKQLDANQDVVFIDADSLRQVLLNCLLNAADAVESLDLDKEILVSTCNPEGDVPGNVLSIVVRDNGKGIAEEDLPYVFDPFFTTKETGKGTGLGLFVCHTIVERMGGSITLCNNPSGGAAVTVTLPTRFQE